MKVSKWMGGVAIDFWAHTQSRNQANTETGKEAASKEHGQSNGGSLENNTEDKDKGGSDESKATADAVGHQG